MEKWNETHLGTSLKTAAELIQSWDEGQISTREYVYNGLRLYAEALDGFDPQSHVGIRHVDVLHTALESRDAATAFAQGQHGGIPYDRKKHYDENDRASFYVADAVAVHYRTVSLIPDDLVSFLDGYVQGALKRGSKVESIFASTKRTVDNIIRTPGTSEDIYSLVFLDMLAMAARAKMRSTVEGQLKKIASHNMQRITVEDKELFWVNRVRKVKFYEGYLSIADDIVKADAERLWGENAGRVLGDLRAVIYVKSAEGLAGRASFGAFQHEIFTDILAGDLETAEEKIAEAIYDNPDAYNAHTRNRFAGKVGIIDQRIAEARAVPQEPKYDKYAQEWYDQVEQLVGFSVVTSIRGPEDTDPAATVFGYISPRGLGTRQISMRIYTVDGRDASLRYAIHLSPGELMNRINAGLIKVVGNIGDFSQKKRLKLPEDIDLTLPEDVPSP